MNVYLLPNKYTEQQVQPSHIYELTFSNVASEVLKDFSCESLQQKSAHRMFAKSNP